jgi:adenosylmethionine-8-amino-7-oxononanoate aminotransferase
MFGSEHEVAIPDMIVLGKGFTGRHLPLAITLISKQISSTFNGPVAEGGALAYGHTYTGNALDAPQPRRVWRFLKRSAFWKFCSPKSSILNSARPLKGLTGVKEVRECEFIAGIETARAQTAAAACIETRRYGVLTRPIWNVVVLMPPMCITIAQLTKTVEALRASITKVWRINDVFARKNAEEITA